MASKKLNLGRSQVRHEDGKIGGAEVNIQSDSLTTHAFISGMTGSGKTALTIRLLTELVSANVPMVIFDIKGDLMNIVQTLDTERGHELHRRMAVRCLTPGAMHGESVNLLHGLSDPEGVHESVTAILKLLGRDHDAIQSDDHSFLSTLIRSRHAQGHPCTLVDLIYAVMEPSFTMLGALPLEMAFGAKQRAALAAALNNLMCAPSFEAWRSGVPLDFSKLLAPRKDKKVPMVIYSVHHLTDEGDKMFALSLAFEAMVRYMREQAGSETLKCLMCVDEIMGLIPPHPLNPSTKRPIMTLLKQGRGYGIGVVLATQNPMDLDYKGMSNCGTWMVGRLQTNHDRDRVIEGICGSGLFDASKLHRKIGHLTARQFVLARNSNIVPFTTADVDVHLTGPMPVRRITELYASGHIQPVDRTQILFNQLDEARRLYAYDKAYESRVKLIEDKLVSLGHTEVLDDSPIEEAEIIDFTDKAALDMAMSLKKESVDKLAETAVEYKLYPNITIAKQLKKPALIKAIVTYRMSE
jgi:hypothetical protein